MVSGCVSTWEMDGTCTRGLEVGVFLGVNIDFGTLSTSHPESFPWQRCQISGGYPVFYGKIIKAGAGLRLPHGLFKWCLVKETPRQPGLQLLLNSSLVGRGERTIGDHRGLKWGPIFQGRLIFLGHLEKLEVFFAQLLRHHLGPHILPSQSICEWLGELTLQINGLRQAFHRLASGLANSWSRTNRTAKFQTCWH